MKIFRIRPGNHLEFGTENLPYIKNIDTIYKVNIAAFQVILMEIILNSKTLSPGMRTSKVSKEIISWSAIGAITGYFMLHPIVHIVSVFHSHTDDFPPSNLSHEIFKAFSVTMLPWGLSFMILCALLGSFWGKINQTDKEKSKAIERLNKALEEVKTLSGFLPICASCKKIRDDKGYWNQIEAYISEHSEAEFSHGICPECCKKLYPDFRAD